MTEPLPFGDGAFAAAVSRLSLMIAPDPEAVLRELARVVAPGGSVVTAVWARIEREPLVRRAARGRGGGAGPRAGRVRARLRPPRRRSTSSSTCTAAPGSRRRAPCSATSSGRSRRPSTGASSPASIGHFARLADDALAGRGGGGRRRARAPDRGPRRHPPGPDAPACYRAGPASTSVTVDARRPGSPRSGRGRRPRR